MIPVTVAPEKSTVPVNIGEIFGAYVDDAVDIDNLASKAACVAVDIGLLASETLSTLPSPTIAFVIPLTVPVNVGLSIGAYVLAAVVDDNLVPTNVVSVAAADSSAAN